MILARHLSSRSEGSEPSSAETQPRHCGHQQCLHLAPLEHTVSTPVPLLLESIPGGRWELVNTRPLLLGLLLPPCHNCELGHCTGVSSKRRRLDWLVRALVGSLRPLGPASSVSRSSSGQVVGIVKFPFSTRAPAASTFQVGLGAILGMVKSARFWLSRTHFGSRKGYPFGPPRNR